MRAWVPCGTFEPHGAHGSRQHLVLLQGAFVERPHDLSAGLAVFMT